MAFTLTFLNSAGEVVWMGGVDCKTAVQVVVSAAKTLREKPQYATVEISDEARLIKRLSRGEVLQRTANNRTW